jgi:hypothetical protein
MMKYQARTPPRTPSGRSRAVIDPSSNRRSGYARRAGATKYWSFPFLTRVPAADGGQRMEGMGERRHLIVVVPGIGGSVLAAPARGSPPARASLTVSARSLLPGLLDLDEQPRLVPVGLRQTLAVAPPLVLHGYGRLRRVIQTALDIRDEDVDVSVPGRNVRPSATLVEFPYDYRLGVRDAAERLKADIDARLAPLGRAERRRRVIVVAHSMGGLVARYWLGPLGGAPVCKALVTLGTPHRGAPKALGWLVNGAWFPLQTMSRTLRGWPAMYDLLPRYPAIWHRDSGRALYAADWRPKFTKPRPPCGAVWSDVPSSSSGT